MPRTIVLAWVSQNPQSFGRLQACVWANEGNSADLRKARDYAAEQVYRVFVFPIIEPFPLRTARALL